LSIDVVTLVRKPSRMRNWLTQYKGRATAEDPLHEEYIPIIRALLGRWLLENDGVLSQRWGDIDALVVVPSTQPERPDHPMEQILRSLDIDIPVLSLLRRGPGKIDWRKPVVDGFVSTTGTPLRVVLIDDVYVTGSRVSSAAHALRRSAHEIAGVIEIARRINPDFDPGFQIFWDTQAAKTFEWQSTRTKALTS
jgi:predicted amidophosphoribosyltransferase